MYVDTFYRKYRKKLFLELTRRAIAYYTEQLIAKCVQKKNLCEKGPASTMTNKERIPAFGWGGV